MSNTIRTKQAVLVAAVVLLVGFLFTRDIKGLPAQDEAEKPSTAQTVEAPELQIGELSATAKNLISTASAKEITALESAYQSADGAGKLDYARQLSSKWDDLAQAGPSAMYTEVVANEEPSLKNWLLAGDRFLQAFSSTQDSLVQPALLKKANTAFTKALALDTASTDAKTGLGITIVNGMGAPMQGITMLLDVVKKDPRNLKANMNLGLFAMKSGQFDKAVQRFSDIVTKIKATPDAYFYLATAYENLGKNQEAIAAYLNSKKLAANPTLSEFIDKKVAELKAKVN